MALGHSRRVDLPPAQWFLLSQYLGPRSHFLLENPAFPTKPTNRGTFGGPEAEILQTQWGHL